MIKKTSWMLCTIFCASVIFASMNVAIVGQAHKIFWLCMIIFIASLMFAGAYSAVKSRKAVPETAAAKGTGRRDEWIIFTFMLLTALLLRVMFALQYGGYYYDMKAFREWSAILANSGMGGFYATQGFGVHPPGYLYVLLLIGKLNTHFAFSETVLNFVLKVPVMLLDLAAGALVYKAARKKLGTDVSLIMMCMWLFNPAILINSAIWGQLDVVFTFFVALTLYFVAEKKLIVSYCMFAVAILMKPQAVVATPALIYGMIDQIFLHGFDKKTFRTHLIIILGVIAAILIAFIPFGFMKTIKIFLDSLHSSQFTTRNAFNLWAMLGKNNIQIKNSYALTGYILVALLTVFSAFVYFRGKGRDKIYFCGGLLVFGTYMLSTQMNERYAYAAVILMLMAYVTNPTGNNARVFCVVSAAVFFSTGWVLFAYSKVPIGPRIYGTADMLLFAYVIYVALVDYCGVDFAKMGKAIVNMFKPKKAEQELPKSKK